MNGVLMWWRDGLGTGKGFGELREETAASGEAVCASVYVWVRRTLRQGRALQPTSRHSLVILAVESAVGRVSGALEKVGGREGVLCCRERCLCPANGEERGRKKKERKC